jgi:hypothetical protein
MTKNFNYILIFLLLIILSSGFYYPGFLNGHGGYAGPHLFSVSLNSVNIDYFINVESVNFISSSDYSYSIYNHHPPLFFRIFSLIFYLSTSLVTKLKVAYFLSTFFNCLGIYLLFKLLNKNKIKHKISFIICLSLLSSNIFLDYRNLITFDSLSILTSVIMLYCFIKIEREKFNFLKIFFLLILTITVSWYNLIIVFSFFLIKLLQSFFKRKYLLFIKSKTFILSVCTGLFSVSLITLLYIEIQYLSLTYNSFEQFSRALSYDYPTIDISFLLKRLIKIALTSLPIISAFIIFYYIISKKYILEFNFINNKIFLIPLISFFAGLVIFFAVNPVWSLYHTYVFIYLIFSSSLFILLFIDLNKFSGLNNLIIFNLIFLVFSLTLEVYRDKNESDITNSLLVQFENLQNNNKLYIYIDPKSKDILYDKINVGRLFYLASYPSKGFVSSYNPINTIFISFDNDANKLIIK